MIVCTRSDGISLNGRIILCGIYVFLLLFVKGLTPTKNLPLMGVTASLPVRILKHIPAEAGGRLLCCA